MPKIIIQEYTTKIPLQMIGREAGVCTNADIFDPQKNRKRAIECYESNHGRTLEFPDIYMELHGYSARVIREFYTHIGGMPTRLQESTRYMDVKAGFSYITPPDIEKNGVVKQIYDEVMQNITDGMRKIAKLGISNEDSAMLLPLGMQTNIVCKINLRNIIEMSHQRMCKRAYWEYQNIMRDLVQALTDYSDEWCYIAQNWLEPKCKYYGYCNEKRSCGLTKRRKSDII